MGHPGPADRDVDAELDDLRRRAYAGELSREEFQAAVAELRSARPAVTSPSSRTLLDELRERAYAGELSRVAYERQAAMLVEAGLADAPAGSEFSQPTDYASTPVADVSPWDLEVRYVHAGDPPAPATSEPWDVPTPPETSRGKPRRVEDPSASYRPGRARLPSLALWAGGLIVAAVVAFVVFSGDGSGDSGNATVAFTGSSDFPTSCSVTKTAGWEVLILDGQTGAQIGRSRLPIPDSTSSSGPCPVSWHIRGLPADRDTYQVIYRSDNGVIADVVFERATMERCGWRWNCLRETWN